MEKAYQCTNCSEKKPQKEILWQNGSPYCKECYKELFIHTYLVTVDRASTQIEIEATSIEEAEKEAMFEMKYNAELKTDFNYWVAECYETDQ